MVTCTKRIEFDAAHRLLSHKGLCWNLHGHRYALEVTLSGTPDPKTGLLRDFSDVKSIVEEHVVSEWDHACLVNESDPILPVLVSHGMRNFVFYGCDPTAEAMAELALAKLRVRLPEVVRVRVYETPTGWAEASVELPGS